MKEKISSNIQRALEWLVDLYNEQRKMKLGNRQFILGRSQIASSLFQLEFAKLLFRDSKLTVLIDYPISFGEYTTKSGKKKKRTLYPDILVIAENTLRGIVELKLDLGYLRVGHYGLEKKSTDPLWSYSGKSDFEKYYSDLLTSEEFYYKYPVGFSHSKPKRVTIPREREKVIKICTVVTKQNNHGRFEAFKESLEDSGFTFMCLLDETHPNERMEYMPTRQDESILEHSKAIKRKIQNELKNREEQIERVFGELF